MEPSSSRGMSGRNRADVNNAPQIESAHGRVYLLVAQGERVCECSQTEIFGGRAFSVIFAQIGMTGAVGPPRSCDAWSA